MAESKGPLDVERIRSRVRGRFGSPIIFLPETGSTNQALRELPASLWSTGLAVLTDFQTAGRGRRGRSWSAPPNSSVLMSLLLALPDSAGPADASMLATLAVADAVQSKCGIELMAKWPNDLLADGRKLCGILAELIVRTDERWAIVGAGINVNLGSAELDELPGAATSLLVQVGRAVIREALVLEVFNRFDLWYRCLTREPGGVFDAWSARLGMIGRDVVVRDASGEWSGRATAVNRDGSLVVDSGSELRTLHAGDVSIRAPEGFTAG